MLYKMKEIMHGLKMKVFCRSTNAEEEVRTGKFIHESIDNDK